MRKLVLLVLLAAQLPAVTAVAQTKPAPATDSLKIYNRMLQPKEMQADLKLFRDIREKANSGIYRYHSKKETDSIYKWAYAAVKKPLPITGFFKIILQLTDFEGSCHNYTEVGADLFKYLNRSQGFFPYDLKYLEGKMIFNQQLPEIPAGSRILSINGVRDTTLMQSFYKYLTGDGYTTTQKLSGSVSRAYGVRYLLEYGIHNQFVLTFTPPNSNEVKSATLPAVTLETRKQNLVGRYSAKLDSIIDYNVQPKYSFRMLDDKTGLLNFRIFSMAWGSDDPAFPGYARWVDSIFQQLDKQAVPNLVIDIRSNPGGSDPNFEQPMMYLTDHDFKENESAYISFNRDAIPFSQYFWGVSASQKYSAEEIKAGLQYLQETYLPYKDGKSMQNPKINPVYHPKQPAYKGHLYLLIDENTASAASHLASLVRAYARNTTIVGVETVGGYYYHNGHAPLVYELPNSKIKTQFSMVAVTQDAPVKPNQPEGRGTMPDYEVWPSYADFMNGKDTQMEYVLRLIREKK
ncbi:S41 family peptidase [Chitinophaga sp. sic0106]|uniref:S41 family peptidase n=1 Tax=Chitinophaga sp. sic0106 TaxID=2854785 RepID=UPI001C47BE36|nr:S41 family peptidase [Chitinophaga sp. sic0106]MBV7532490.1 S41 family peptidase [Chitinophaga sp. sic0106]